jgi:hypothetical protein
MTTARVEKVMVGSWCNDDSHHNSFKYLLVWEYNHTDYCCCLIGTPCLQSTVWGIVALLSSVAVSNQCQVSSGPN